MRQLNYSNSSGVGLIEILVCIGVSIVVLGGALFFYVNSLKENQYINQLNIARQYINEVADFDEIILLYEEDFEVTLTSEQSLNTGYCSSYCNLNQFYESFIEKWHKRMKNDLVGARFRIELKAVNEGQVSLAWDNKNFVGEGAGPCIIKPLPEGYVCFTGNIR